MNARVFRIWFLLCVGHVVLFCLILPVMRGDFYHFIRVFYFTALFLAEFGIPGLVVPAEGWGWPFATPLGMTISVFVWILAYFLTACLIGRLLNKK